MFQAPFPCALLKAHGAFPMRGGEKSMPNDLSNAFETDVVHAAPLRPDGALPEWAFQEACTGCGDCEAVCPKHLIRLDVKNGPVLIDTGRCSRCGLCADVCMRGAIEFTPRTRRGLARITQDNATL
jgi:ferredoxin